MAFTYDITTNRGKVRRALGDTNEAQPFLTDAEIDEALTMGSSLAQSIGIALEWAIASEIRAAAIYADPADGQAVKDHALRMASLQALRALYGGTVSADNLVTVGYIGPSPSDPTCDGVPVVSRCGC